MNRKNLKKKIENLEKEVNPENLWVLRLIYPRSQSTGPFREVRQLRQDDGSQKGRFIRRLEPGELVEGALQGMTRARVSPVLLPRPTLAALVIRMKI